MQETKTGQETKTEAAAIGQREVAAHLDGLTKPPGSLGELERLAARLCEIQGTLRPETRPRRLVVFAADHGVVDAGVSAWPREVTTMMIDNIRAGGAACCALAAASQTELCLVDCGAAGPARAPGPGFRVARVADGTANLAEGPAMSVEQLERALEVGREEARLALATGHVLLLAGEMGIGNTTPASALTALLADAAVDQVVGRGAGIDDEGLERKRQVIARALERARAADEPRAAIAAIAGFEIAAIAGYFLEGHAGGATLVVDGAIASAGALIAQALEPEVTRSMIAAHRSVEPGHGVALAALGLEPFLDWSLRLGEGTGALLLAPMLDAAAAMVRDMATLESLGLGG